MTNIDKKPPRVKGKINYKLAQVNSNEETNKKARLIGSGNLSAGFRIAVKSYNLEKDKTGEDVA